LGEIGRGAFGTVNKMVHRRSNTVMAVKVDYSISIVKFALVKIEQNSMFWLLILHFFDSVPLFVGIVGSTIHVRYNCP